MNHRSSFLSPITKAGRKAIALLREQGQKKHAEHQENQPAPPMQPEQNLTGGLSDMIRCDHFQLVVQPVVDLETGSIVGGEVLSRLNHPERGVIFPDKYLPALAKAGLYSKFDHYIFRKTCSLISRLSDQNVNIQYLSCNFSRITLSEKGIATRLSRIADEYGVAHHHLAVEITEQNPATDDEQFCRNVCQLKEAGFRIFVDDMGAGVTSFRDLWSYPVDVVKIDRSLLLDAESEQGRIVYRALRNLATDLGCKVLCEGVETEDQHRFVTDVKCHYCQGFLFYRPMEDATFMHLLCGKHFS